LNCGLEISQSELYEQNYLASGITVTLVISALKRNGASSSYVDKTIKNEAKMNREEQSLTGIQKPLSRQPSVWPEKSCEL